MFNAGLSLAFFLQHSIMVRRSFKQRLSKIFPDAYHGAIYSIASGVFLFAVVILWQSTTLLWQAEGITRLFVLPVAGFFWAVRSLGSFDPFGIKGIYERLRARKPQKGKFIVGGPYRRVRHPLYFFLLIMLWACPDLSVDRLLFNIMWSAWIVIGAYLEERDLAREFGSAYCDYQKNVPMLIPFKWKPAGK